MTTLFLYFLEIWLKTPNLTAFNEKFPTFTEKFNKQFDYALLNKSTWRFKTFANKNEWKCVGSSEFEFKTALMSFHNLHTFIILHNFNYYQFVFLLTADTFVYFDHAFFT